MLNRLEDTLAGPGSVSATFSSQLEIVECAEILTNIRRETVLVCLQKYHPSSIAELKKRLNEEGIRSADEDLLEIVRELQSDGEIGLLDPVMLDSFPHKRIAYLGEASSEHISKLSDFNSDWSGARCRIFLYGRFQRVSFHWLCYCGNHLCFSSKIFRVKSQRREGALTDSAGPDSS